MLRKSTQKRRQSNTALMIPIIVALISLMGVCITVIGGVVTGVIPDLIRTWFSKPNQSASSLQFHVLDTNGLTVSKAKVVLVTSTAVWTKYTDSIGVATFSVESVGEKRVFVETGQFRILDQNIPSDITGTFELRLEPKDIESRNVIVRVFDSEIGIPIENADITLLANGDPFTETSDSNGLATFNLAFPTDEIEGDITVNFGSYNIERQRVTLQADHVQDISLDKENATLAVTDIQAEQQEGAPTEPVTTLPLTVARDVACIVFQDASRLPVEVKAETIRYFGFTSLALANGENIPFTNMGNFEIVQISDDDVVRVTINFVNGTQFTEDLRYAFNLSGDTERGDFSIDIRGVRRVVFGPKGSCQ